LYEKLKDYEPTIDFSYRLNQINEALNVQRSLRPEDVPARRSRVPGFWNTILSMNTSTADTLALTKVLTNHEAAMNMNSPKGLLLHGEVGTGKSMLIDLFVKSLPTKRKRRWHYNTFMLQMVSQLEQMRRDALALPISSVAEYSLLTLARNLIHDSPVLFLDEFQLPDRMAATTLSNLMTIFFRLGGVLIATSNRLPDELAKAAGLQYPPSTLLGSANSKTKLHDKTRKKVTLPGNSEFTEFLDLLKARCDVWQLDGTKDYRREDSSLNGRAVAEISLDRPLDPEPKVHTDFREIGEPKAVEAISLSTPKYYSLYHSAEMDHSLDTTAQGKSLQDLFAILPKVRHMDFAPAKVKVFGRIVHIPRSCQGISLWTFEELCFARYGPADYITLSSNFHTVAIVGVPVLTTSLKNEARRFITLLDALYEAGCKLFISAHAIPDELFFPDLTIRGASKRNANGTERDWTLVDNESALHAETFAEVHQDLSEPFRPNISSYREGTLASFGEDKSNFADDALEDDPPNRIRREALSGLSEMQRLEKIERLGSRPNFSDSTYFTGEDEKFAYKRAVSRLWEMCGDRWWSEERWNPLPDDQRHWEISSAERSVHQPIAENNTNHNSSETMGESRDVNEAEDAIFRNSVSPFRTILGPPPHIGEEHIWDARRWGKRAGVWGKGVDGLQDRHRSK
jgi:peroxisome-assembly ATPase